MDVKYIAVLSFVWLLISCSDEGASSGHPNTDDGRRDGQALYIENCAACHGTDGKLGVSGARDLASIKLDSAEIYQILVEGKNLMPPFGYILTTEEERNAIVEQVISLRE